jgi:excisionase family DNA binding protein
MRETIARLSYGGAADRELPTAADTLAPRDAVLEHQGQLAEDWLLPHEAAERLGIAANTLGRWARDEQIRHTVTNGGHRRYLKHDVEALKEKLTKQSRKGCGNRATEVCPRGACPPKKRERL